MLKPSDPHSRADSLFATVQRDLAGQYSLERELGRGGMAVVFLAREVELDRLVALKVLPPEKAGNSGFRERFLREARMAASLSHPNIVPIHRVGEAGETVYFSMTFIDGGTLGDRLRSRGPLSPSATARMLREVAQALAYAHGRGIVHRDVKPDNILLDSQSGRALVSDFGIASVVTTADSANEEIMGTAHFMSPEQAAGLSVDGRSDLYSLGVLGHLALSGRLPGRNELQHPEALAARSPASKSLASVAPSSPRSLVAAIERARALDPAARYQSAEAFATAIEPKSATRRDLPPVLQRWVDERDPWHTVYVICEVALAFSALFELAFDGLDIEAIPPFLMIAAIPVIPALIFQIRSASRVLRAGYSAKDICAALDHERDAQPEPGGGAASRPPWFHMPLRIVAWSLASLVLYSVTDHQVRWPQFDKMQHFLGDGGLVSFVFPIIVPVFCTLALPLLTALGIPLLPPGKSGSTRPLSRWFWASKFGRFAEKYLTRDRRIAAPSTTFRATESVLGTAVMDLFHALPSVYREQIPDLPAIIEKLQAHAGRARASLAHLERATFAGDAEVEEFSKRSRRELTESVTALETIRLDLLRLLGGDADMRPTTTVLHAARRIGEELDRLQEAQREVDIIVPPLGLDLRPNSPA